MNREKIIKGVHDARRYLEDREWVDKSVGVHIDALNDALALLKEQEVKTGHWIDTTNIIGFPRCECSECNSEAGAIWMKYCPNCGAKMEGR